MLPCLLHDRVSLVLNLGNLGNLDYWGSTPVYLLAYPVLSYSILRHTFDNFIVSDTAGPQTPPSVSPESSGYVAHRLIVSLAEQQKFPTFPSTPSHLVHVPPLLSTVHDCVLLDDVGVGVLIAEAYALGSRGWKVGGWRMWGAALIVAVHLR